MAGGRPRLRGRRFVRVAVGVIATRNGGVSRPRPQSMSTAPLLLLLLRDRDQDRRAHDARPSSQWRLGVCAAFATISFVHNRARAMGFQCPNPGHHPILQSGSFSYQQRAIAPRSSWPASVYVAGWNPEQSVLVLSSGSVSDFPAFCGAEEMKLLNVLILIGPGVWLGSCDSSSDDLPH